MDVYNTTLLLPVDMSSEQQEGDEFPFGSETKRVQARASYIICRLFQRELDQPSSDNAFSAWVSPQK